MTNKTTEQDMEAKSVDTNDAATIKASEVSREVASESFGDDATRHATHEDSLTDLPEDTAPEEPPAIEEKVDYSIIEPGSLSRALKKCRDEADMSIEDAAQEMHLPLSIVNALESESFADLPDPPYVRGYLRSYARLNESDPGNLINHYETLRGADPKDIASFTPTTPRYQPGSKKSVSPTTIKLAGFSMIIMLMVVLSMIPAVSQWASDTWQSFSEPQQQKLASRDTPEQNAETQTADNTNTERGKNTPETQNTQDTASMGDTVTPDKSEQIAVNQEVADAAARDRETAQDRNKETAADSAEVASRDEQPEQVAGSAEPDTGESDTPTPTENAGKTAASPDKDNTTDKEQDIAGNDQEKTATTAGDTDESAPETNTDATAQSTAEAGATAVEEAAAAAKKAEADKLAAQQAAARRNDNFKQPIDGSVLIRLVFTQPVWMSIQDGRGKTIFASLNAAGTRKELRANTPLLFKVGNAQGVQIYLNGQLVDQKPHTRGSVSTFRAH